MAKRLRSGYTTGACAAAAAKAAALAATDGVVPKSVEIVFPDLSLHRFMVSRGSGSKGSAIACIIKDAGDDPDVTNGAEICAQVSLLNNLQDSRDPSNGIIMDNIVLSAGEGVGRVTKPGLAVAVGEPAINPVPRKMICQAVRDVVKKELIHVTITIPLGRELAEKTLNRRLGIEGGLSVLGTTGIVRPVSAEAWTATIEASMNVAREVGLTDIVLSTGRTSEKGTQTELDLPEEAYAMMGDYLHFSLKKAAELGFERIHLSGMWAKIVKAAMRIPQTHVRNGALEVTDAAQMLAKYGATGELLEKLHSSNTAREMYGHLVEAGRDDIIRMVCELAKSYGEDVTGKEVRVYLVDAKAKVVMYV